MTSVDPGVAPQGAHRAAETDWPRIAALYDRLRVVAPSPVVDLNRAIAHSMANVRERAFLLARADACD